jgi:hypothetical protein
MTATPARRPVCKHGTGSGASGFNMKYRDGVRVRTRQVEIVVPLACH